VSTFSDVMRERTTPRWRTSGRGLSSSLCPCPYLLLFQDGGNSSPSRGCAPRIGLRRHSPRGSQAHRSYSGILRFRSPDSQKAWRQLRSNAHCCINGRKIKVFLRRRRP